MEEFLQPEPVSHPSSMRANMRFARTTVSSSGSVRANMCSARPAFLPSGVRANMRSARIIHSPEHVILDCPLTAPFRHIIYDSILGSVNVRNLFYTIEGEAPATFLLRSNSLLRPLPPRPDPP